MEFQHVIFNFLLVTDDVPIDVDTKRVGIAVVSYI